MDASAARVADHRWCCRRCAGWFMAFLSDPPGGTVWSQDMGSAWVRLAESYPVGLTWGRASHPRAEFPGAQRRGTGGTRFGGARPAARGLIHGFLSDPPGGYFWSQDYVNTMVRLCEKYPEVSLKPRQNTLGPGRTRGNALSRGLKPRSILGRYGGTKVPAYLRGRGAATTARRARVRSFSPALSKGGT
jgi:hypothetical protein